MAGSQRATFTEMPGKGIDVMQDFDVSVLGYEETEYHVEGTALSYELKGERGTDGRWEVTEGPSAPFRTRIVVRRPADPCRSARAGAPARGGAVSPPLRRNRRWKDRECQPSRCPAPG